MPDGLPISGGGETTSVITDELVGAATQLESLTRESASLRAELGAIDGLLTWGELRDAPADAKRAEVDLDRAVMFLHQAELQAQFFSWALSQAADGYSAVEFGARRLLGGAIDGLGTLGGMLAPLLAPLAATSVTGVALLSPADRNRLLSDPTVVGAVRAGVMGADDALMARAGIPAPIAALLGDQGLGLSGLSTAAGALGAVGALIGMRPAPDVRVASQQALPSAPAPSGFVDRLSRVPDPFTRGGPQVTIEKYEMPDGEIRAEVYIAGTVDFDPWVEGQPWDMASNIANAAGESSGSAEAVRAAMREAGLDADTPVQFTGYSQGAATAARLVSSGDFDARGLVTFGGPTGQIPLPESVPTVLVEHTDDLVAALGGRQDNTHAVLVQRYATEGMEFDGSELMPGHRVEGYLETARLMDSDPDATLAGAAASVAGFTEGGVLVSRTAYEIDRVSGPSS
ncbi:hypothetical protein [Antiquaquibacter soli]|uniref:Uncharacterized protein n=1 Tax=Antiquaquibacter soli TaxID=3064523 RepID=A0ABT9BQ75_9MICO|nr:hypothetical protein [Protaetiibacter sp. WY-16]MDO7883145.1 hypothetical protein [Protaetiibacter sp. WY-16]